MRVIVERKLEDSRNSRKIKAWIDGDYLYIRDFIMAKPDNFLDRLTEVDADKVPEVLAKMTFLERLKPKKLEEFSEAAYHLGFRAISSPSICGDPVIYVSRASKWTKSISGKLLFSLLYNLDYWVLTGYDITICAKVDKVE